MQYYIQVCTLLSKFTRPSSFRPPHPKAAAIAVSLLSIYESLYFASLFIFFIKFHKSEIIWV